MSFLNSTYKRRAAISTFLVHFLLVLLLYSFGLEYTDPKIEEGISIEFGYSEQGIGDKIIQSNKTQVDNIKFTQEVQTNDIEFLDPILTQDIHEVEVSTINKKHKFEKKSKQNKIQEHKVQASMELQNALSSLFQNKENIESGFTDKNGSQGILEGSLITSDMANGGEGNISDGYELGNRTVVRKPKPKYSCSETGRVVIRVWVNGEGITYKAELDLKNTTETDACLVREAKSAALNTTWLADPNVGPVQIGSIIYNFSKK